MEWLNLTETKIWTSSHFEVEKWRAALEKHYTRIIVSRIDFDLSGDPRDE